jgi:Zn-dependent protease with chaperone function/Flp pilus assembly protein TadD
MSMLSRRAFFLTLAGLMLFVSASSAVDSPPRDEVAAMLQKQPITLATWPEWRTRLLSWIDDKSRNAEPAYDASREFLAGQVDARGELPAALANDPFAWYTLGSAYLYKKNEELDKAEKAFRRSLALDPKFARGHRNLALTLYLQEPLKKGATEPGIKIKGKLPPGMVLPGARRLEAKKELDEAKKLDPALSVSDVEFRVALSDGDFAAAERAARKMREEDPKSVHGAQALAIASLARPRENLAIVDALAKEFPDDGVIACFHAGVLRLNEKNRDALNELERARSLGTKPEEVLSPSIVREIESAAAPGWIEQTAWAFAYFAGFYLVVMLLMAGAGVILASRTRGARALELLGNADEMVSAGQVARTHSESLLTRLYAFSLFLGLILFYVSIPFVLVGLLIVTLGLLYLIFLMGRIPIKLVVIVVVVGLGGIWAVLKSVFSGIAGGGGNFGVAKTAEECPRLHQVLLDVAKRVDTEPIHEVYLAPGSSISVHQQGRGPFGIFGVKRRVLTLGLSTMRFLNVSELKAILAHEYAHFSHQDTFYSRFIYQVNMAITQALDGMGQSGGAFNYVNPFYWFLYLYHKSYELLSAGFSRSREYLADRMAASLFGGDVFAEALKKVCTDGTLFEMTIYQNITGLLAEGKSFVNMYEAFKNYRDQQLTNDDRDKLYNDLLEEKESLFASHPTFGERVAAVQGLAKATENDTRPALELFDNPEEVEKELTDFLTGFLYHIQQLQAAAAQQE